MHEMGIACKERLYRYKAPWLDSKIGIYIYIIYVAMGKAKVGSPKSQEKSLHTPSTDGVDMSMGGGDQRVLVLWM